jgi:predicted NAD/FAD-binding protein
MKIAIVGSGISGIMAASTLHENGHDITVFEADSHIGGHIRTIRHPLVGEEKPLILELGVFMHDPQLMHPRMNLLMKELGIDIAPLELTFSFTSAPHNCIWETTSLSNSKWIRNLSVIESAVKHSLGKGKVIHQLRHLAELNRYMDQLPAICSYEKYLYMSIEDFAKEDGYSEQFLESYLLPQVLCWWGAEREAALASSIQVVSDSFYQVSQAPQYVFKDGWDLLVDKVCKPFTEKIKTNHPVEKLLRDGDHVKVLVNGESATFDAVVLAVAPCVAAKLIEMKTSEEKTILGSFDSVKTHVYLHTDCSLMPKERDRWSMGNLIQDQRGSIASLWSGHLDPRKPEVFITWGEGIKSGPDESKIILEESFLRTLPTVDYAKSSKSIQNIQGNGGIWHCGAHVDALDTGTPSLWHENAFRSGIAVSKKIESSKELI